MKPRILFVDDESLALQGMQRMLRSMRNEWDMFFIEGGKAALDWMAQQSVDVVVSDMLMPGMNGVELLDFVRQRHPKTTRLILSGHAEKDLILQSVRCSHRFLSKPCQPEVLKSAIQRSLVFGKHITNEAIRDVVYRMDWLPAIPSIYAQFLETLQSPTVSLGEVASLVSRDLGLSATVLKLANSGFFGNESPIPGVAEAVSYLGVEAIKTLVFSIQASSPFESAAFYRDSLDILWKHSLQVAQGARAISLAENASAFTADCSFAAGLLHDVGKFILVSHFPEQYSQVNQLVRESEISLISAENQVFGTSHALVGASLLGLWGLPAQIVDAILFHHEPEKSNSRGFTPLAAVYVANELSNEYCQSSAAFACRQIDSSWLDRAGLADRLPAWQAALSKCLT